MRIDFIKMGINGEGIGYLEDKTPVFCPGVFPGETAEIKILEDHGSYAKAELLRLVKECPDRVVPECRAEVECGSPLMALRYEKQLECKQQLFEQALYKYARTSRKNIRPIKASPLHNHYRTECKLPFGMHHEELAVGLFRPGTNHFVPAKHFASHTEELEATRLSVLHTLRRYKLTAYDAKYRKGMRTLVLRVINGNAQLILVTGRDTLPPRCIEDLMKIKGMRSVAQSINTERKNPRLLGSYKLLAGSETMDITINGLTLALSPRSFFQLNIEQASLLYEMAISKIDPCDTLVEAYCGVGAMSLLASKKAREIIGMESIQSAVDNATENAKRNEIRNARFLCRDAGEGLKEILSQQEVNTLLVDPPRTGLDEVMIDAILNSKIKKIIYVSCEPSTLGKNLQDLKKHYDIRTIIPYDMFPETPHIESITVIERRGGE